MNEELERCPGSYYGQQLHNQCIECKRLLRGYQAGHWYIKVPVFTNICNKRLIKHE